jgi:competence protein ComEA
MTDNMDLQGEKGSPLDKWLINNKITVSLFLLGIILISLGVLALKGAIFNTGPKIEFLDANITGESSNQTLIVEIAGAVEKPGVYQFKSGARVEDVLIMSGGASANADRQWMDKMLNRAARISDGQKIYIPEINDGVNDSNKVLVSTKNELYQTTTSASDSLSEKIININTADNASLESLWGIGRVTAQNIIEQRPYSSIEDLLTKKIIRTNVFEKIKDQITVY